MLPPKLAALAVELIRTTVRHFFYVAVARGLLPKTEAAYDKLCEKLADLRRKCVIDWGHFVDEGRDVIYPYCFDSAGDRVAAIRSIIMAPRGFWQDQPLNVIVVTEKDAITAILRPDCNKWQVPLAPLSGFSAGFLHEDVAPLLSPDKLNVVLEFFDFDGSGWKLRKQFERDLFAYRLEKRAEARLEDRDVPAYLIEFVHVAVTEEQIALYDLPTRPDKKKAKTGTLNAHSVGFKSKVAVELDAMEPEVLQSLLLREVKSRIDWSLLRKSLRRASRDRKETIERVARGEASTPQARAALERRLVPLNLSPNVRKAVGELRRGLAAELHPDRGGDAAKHARLNAALDTLVAAARQRPR